MTFEQEWDSLFQLGTQMEKCGFSPILSLHLTPVLLALGGGFCDLFYLGNYLSSKPIYLPSSQFDLCRGFCLPGADLSLEEKNRCSRTVVANGWSSDHW